MWLRRAIERYARAHPNASDTAEGIAEWWIPRGHRWTPDDLQRALDELVASSVLRCTRLPGGTLLYSVSREARR